MTGGGGGSSSIGGSTDVALSNAADGQVLRYNGTQAKWNNAVAGKSSVLRVTYNTSTSSWGTRPNADYVEWVGPVDPGVLAQDYDTWLDTSAAV